MARITTSNRQPVVTHDVFFSPTYLEDAAPVTISPGLRLYDDGTTLAGATVQVARHYVAGQDVLAYTSAHGITGSFDPASGTLILTGAATLAQYQEMLRSVTYENTSADPAGRSRHIVFQVDDGQAVSDPRGRSRVNLRIDAINDAPQLTVDPTMVYATPQAPALIDPALLLTDPDSLMRSAQVRIAGNYIAGEDVLSATSSRHIRVRFDASEGVLTLQGRGTAAEYQEVLRSVTYTNTSPTPSPATRTLEFQVRDTDRSDDHEWSNVAVVSLVTPGPPVVTTPATPLPYTEGDAPLTLAPTLTLSDADNPDLAGATITISAGLQAGDSLLFTNTAAITGSFDSATGVLTLVGTASQAAYQAALRTVQFVSTSESPGTARTITWVASDGSGDPAPTATTTIAVTSVNDTPSLSAGGTASFTENGAAVLIAPSAAVSDVDAADFNGGSLSVGFTANGRPADQLTIVDQGVAAGEIGVNGGSVTYGGLVIGTCSGGSGGAALSIAFTSAAATPAAAQALVRAIAFSNTSDDPTASARTVRFTLSDGDGGAGTVTSDANVGVTVANDAPVVTTGGGATPYTEGDAPVAVDASLALSDPDNTSFTAATVQISGGFESTYDVLAFTGTGSTGNIVAGAFDGATGRLALTSAGGTATAAQWQAALEAVTFHTTSASPGSSRTVAFQLDDGQAANNLSAVATHAIAITEVNSQPTLTPGSSSAAFVEDMGGAVVVDGGIVVADADTTDLVGATVRIAGGFHASEDVLSFTPVGSVSGTYDAGTGVLTLGGLGTLAQYQQALASVTYGNTSDTPDTATRTLEFVVDDGQSVSNLSDIMSRSVTVASTNDAPDLSAASTLGYTEGDSAAAIAPAASVADVDSADFDGGSISVAFAANGTAADQLVIADQGTGAGQIGASAGAITYEGIAIGSFTGGASGAQLDIAFAGAAATPAAVQALVRAITFANTSENPSALSRSVSFTLADGDGGSDSATATINVTAVNDAPAITGSIATPLAYKENDAPAVIDSGLTLADPDSATLIGATITVANHVTGEDVLAFTPAGLITGSFDPATGTLTLGGSDTLANYEAALHSVTYANSSDNPGAGTRTIGIQVDDGAGANHASNITTRDITVSPVNDAPAISAGAGVSYTEGAAPLAVSGSLTLADAEGDAITGATASITANFAAGQDTLSFTPAGSITGSFDSGAGVLTLSGGGTPAEYQSVLRSVSYANSSDTPSAGGRTVTFQATDSHGDTGADATATVSITAANDAPVTSVPANASIGTAFSNTSLSIAGVSVSDVDAGAANVQTTVSAANGVLSFGLAGGAGATGNGTGSVVLTGSLTQVNAALATLSYKSADGFEGADTVSVITNDLGATGPDGAQLSNGGVANTFQVGVIPQVFVIDNTDGTTDSAASGLAADPFNSVASFNTLAGDGAGDYIYVKQGSGSYSEADGFNLLAGQHLVGQGQTLQFTNPVTGAVVTIGTGSSGATPTLSVTGAGAHGVDLGAGNFITGLNIATTQGDQTGIADGGGTVGSLTVSDVDVTGVGMAIDIDQGGALAVTIDKLTSTGSTQQGVQLAGATLTGSFTAGATAGSAVSGSAGTAFLVGDGAGTASTGGTAAIGFGGTISSSGTVRAVDIEDRPAAAGTITLSGNLSHTGGSANGVVIDDIASGTINLSGASNTLDTGTAGAIVLSDTGGATVNFSGAVNIVTTSGAGISLANTGAVAFNTSGAGLDIVTAGGAGISGTTGSSLVIAGSSNSIATTNAAAVNLGGVTIGAAGLNFQSISASGGANGIALSGGGSAGSLTVTGTTGVANSGGTIQATTADGVSVTGSAVNLGYMLIQNTAGAGVLATNLAGASSLSNSTITGFDAGGANTENGLTIVNTNSNLASMVVSNTTFSGGATGNDGIFIQAQGTSNMTLQVKNSIFTGLFRDAIGADAIAGATGTMRLTVSGSTFTSAVASTGDGGISLTPAGDANLIADIDANTFTGVMNRGNNLGVIDIQDTATSDADITIRNNIISSIGGGRGISIAADGGTTDLRIDNNSIDSLGSTSKPAIAVQFASDAVAGTSATGNVTLSNNDIGQAGALWTSGNGAVNAILLQTLGSSSMTAAITGNVIDANTGSVIEVVRLRSVGTTTLDATVTGNNIQDTETTQHVEFDATAGVNGTTPQGGTINLTFTGNNLNTGGTMVLTENTLGTLNVTQAGSAALTTLNSGVTVTTTGTPNYGQSAPAAPTTPSLPLLAHDDAGAGNGGAVTLADLSAIAAAAVQRWEALPLTGVQHAALDNLSFGLADMSGTLLGTSVSGSVVLIDLNAAGHGWYVDASPLDDAEFSVVTATHLVAPADAAAGRLDLLTAVMHEIGHVLGLPDAYSQDSQHSLMYGYLEAGERRVPGEAELLTLVGVGPAGEA